MLSNEELMAINGYSEDDLEHYGILGMKWGIRRYENPDGSLTEAGKRRYAKYERKKQRVMQSGDAKKILKFRKNLTDEEFDTAMARVAKTDALRYNANAEKREKQEARAAEKAEKKQAKLTKKEMANAKKIAEQNAKQSVKSRDFVSTIAKAAAITGTIYTLYKNVSGIANAVGIDISPASVTKLFKKEKENKGYNISIDDLSKQYESYYKDDKDGNYLKDFGKTIASRQKSQQTNKTVWNMPDASDKRVDLNTKSINSFFNNVNSAKSSQNTDRVNSFFNTVNKSKPTPAPKKGTDNFDFYDVFGLDKTRNGGIIGRGEGDKLRYGGDLMSRDGKEYRRWDPDALSSRRARLSSEGIGSSFVPSLSQERVNTGTEIVKNALSGTIEGTGTHFKNTSASSLPKTTLSLGTNTVNNILSLPYDPDKKF